MHSEAQALSWPASTADDAQRRCELAQYVGHVYHQANIVLAFDGTGSLTNRYLHGPLVDQILADENLLEDDVFWALSDHLGTVRTLLDNQGNRIRDRVFSAWGQITSDTNPTVFFPFGFTGREYDPESGLYYYRARYYDPATGRFISQDPLGFSAGDTNLSRYVFNSPTNFTDPTGQVIQVLIGAGIGAVVGGIIGGLTGADGWDWDRFWAGAASGALVGSGFGVLAAGAAATGIAATGISALGGGLIGAGLSGAFGGALAWGRRGVDWTLWLQHTYWGFALGAIGGATYSVTTSTVTAIAPAFVKTTFGQLLTAGGAGALADASFQGAAIAVGLQHTYRPLQGLAAAGASMLFQAGGMAIAAARVRFRTTPKPDLTPGTPGSGTPIGKVTPPSEEYRPGTVGFRIEMHRRIAKWIKELYPKAEFKFNVEPSQRGIDVEVRGPGATPPPFKWAEIKPRKPWQIKKLEKQLLQWGLKPEEVTVITYDEAGNIYIGFD